MDELELACQLDQWRVHGCPDLDPMPGYFLSPFMKRVCIQLCSYHCYRYFGVDGFHFTLAAGSRVN